MAKRNTPEKFWSKVNKSGECWVWQGTFNRDGYGVFLFGGRKQGAHRLAWILTNGPIADKMYVCHKCDNPSCCNPDHLFVGTHRDNMLDMRQKGRGKIPCFRGSASSQAKLQEKDVIAIRKALENGVKQSVLAIKYGVRQSQISHIKTKKKWAHL